MSNVEVNALFGYDDLKIIASYKNKNKNILIHDSKISLIDNRNNVKNNIKSSIKDIENKINIQIKNINIIFDDFMKNSDALKLKTKIIEEKIKFNESKILDLENGNKIIKSLIQKSKNKELDDELISIVPFRFIYIDENMNEKESTSFPFNEKINQLKIIFSARYMNKEKFIKSIDYFDSLDLKINNVALESQLSIYEAFDKNYELNKMQFVISIRDEKSYLISSSNNVVIKTDLLNYSLNNLIKKISEKFNISNQETNNLINCYNSKIENLEEQDEIIYSSSNTDNNQRISKKEITDVIKSFLKSICTQANNIINSIIGNNNIDNISVKIIGKLSNEDSVKNYCTKYFDKVNICLFNENDEIYKWNKSYMSCKKYWSYIETLNNKINPDIFYSEDKNNGNINNDLSDEKTKLFDVIKNSKTKALLA